MRYLKIYSIFIFGSILLIGLSTILVRKKFNQETEQALNDYSMLPDDQKVTDKVILGREEDRLRSGAISLICINRKNVSLIVQDSRSRNYKEGASGSGKGKFKAYNHKNNERVEVNISNMTPVSRDYFYTYMSDPLSEQEITSIMKILEIKGISRIKISTFDGGDLFTSKFDISEVKQLISNCHS